MPPTMETKPPPSTLWQDLKDLPGQYWILFSGTLINRFGHFVIPFLAIYLRQQGHSAGTMGVVIGAYGMGGLVAGPIGGYLADRLGRKHTMVISCVGGAIFMLALSLAKGVPMLMVATFLNGLFTAMYGPAVAAFIADLVPPELRVRAFSTQRLAINFGYAAGMAAAGFMARYSFSALFVIDAATTLILGAAVFFGLKPRLIPSNGAPTGWPYALRHMRTNVAFQLSALSCFLITLVFWQLSSSFGLQATEGAGLDERTYGLLMALNGVMIVCLELPLTSFTRLFHAPRLMAAGYAVLGIGMGVNALGASLPVLVTSMVIFTIGEMMALPVGNSYLASLAPDDMRGRYQGMISITGSLGTLVGPSMGISLYQYNAPLLWILILVIAFLSAGLMLASAKKDPAAP